MVRVVKVQEGYLNDLEIVAPKPLNFAPLSRVKAKKSLDCITQLMAVCQLFLISQST